MSLTQNVWQMPEDNLGFTLLVETQESRQNHSEIRQYNLSLSELRPEFTIVIFIHYKPRIAVAIIDL